MFDQPRRKRQADGCSGLRLVDDALLLADLGGWLDGLQELNGQAVSLMEVGDIAVEAGLGVVIGQEADVLEFIAEDW